MKQTITRLSKLSIITAILLILALGIAAIALTTTSSYALADLSLDRMSVDFDVDLSKHSHYVEVHRAEGVTEKIDSVVSSDPLVTVPAVGVTKGMFILTATGTGDTLVQVTGTDGTIIILPVHVGDSGFQKSLSSWSDIDTLKYGHTTFQVESFPGTRVSVKVGKDKYKTFTMPAAKGDDIVSSKKVKVDKRTYNVGTKVTVTFTNGSAKATRTAKVKSETNMTDAAASGKTFKASCWDLHKGDTVRLTVANKTYTKKIKKNHTSKYYNVKITTRKTIKQNAKFKVVIKNKYKKTLDTCKAKLYKGKWSASDNILD